MARRNAGRIRPAGISAHYSCTNTALPYDQLAEEEDVTGRGAGNARADFVVWRTGQDKADRKPPLIIVECKADNVTIRPHDYAQVEP